MTAHFERYPRADEEYGWRLVAGNGKIVAGGEGYTRVGDVERGIRDVLEAAFATVGERFNPLWHIEIQDVEGGE